MRRSGRSSRQGSLLGVVAILTACSSSDSAKVQAVGLKPPVPRIIAPANGAYTGAVLRPLIIWERVELGIKPITYQIELDDGCRPGAHEGCSFSSPARRATGLTSAQWHPEKALAVSLERPIGRRYYYRVRACTGELCSRWSRLRYLEVGRSRGDVNGDGFSDIVVGAPLVDNRGADSGSVFIYHGKRSGLGRLTRIDDPSESDGSNFGVAVAMAGDVNADGFADIVVGAAGADEARGATFVFLGSAMGVWPGRRIMLSKPESAVDDWFGAAVAGAGDVDGDGFADVVVGASGTNRNGQDWGVAYLYRGAARHMEDVLPATLGTPSSRNYDHFGFTVSSAGDLDNDGFADVVVGSPGIDMAGMKAGTDRGAVYIFRGRGVGISTTAPTRLEAPVPLDHDRFGWSVSGAGDLDGDGYDDLVVGAPGRDGSTIDGGTAYVYRGGAGGVDRTPAVLLQDPRGYVFDRFGTSVAGIGDVDGDGYCDIAVGTSSSRRGRALIYHGWSEVIPITPAMIIGDPLGDGFNDFAENVAGAGDVNGDGYDDLIIGASGADNGGVFRGSVVVYAGTAQGIAPSHPLRRDDPDQGEHDHFGHVVAGR